MEIAVRLCVKEKNVNIMIDVAMAEENVSRNKIKKTVQSMIVNTNAIRMV